MQSSAMHVKLYIFRDGDARLLVPAGMRELECIKIFIWHADELVLQASLKVKHFNSGKAFLSLPSSNGIIWQHGEKVIMGVTDTDSIEIIRSVKYFEQVHIGPGDVDLTD